MQAAILYTFMRGGPYKGLAYNPVDVKEDHARVLPVAKGSPGGCLQHEY